MPVKFDLMGSCSTGERYIRIRWSCGGVFLASTASKKIFPSFWLDGAVIAPAQDTVINELGWSASVMKTFLCTILRRCREYEARARDVDEDGLRKALAEIVGYANDDASADPLTVGRHRLNQVVCTFIDEESARREWTPATIIQYKKLLRLLNDYSPRAFVEDVRLTWTEGFFGYLVARLSERTVRSMMINYRSFVKWAIPRYRVDERAMNFTYKTRENVKDLVFLNADELRALASLQFPDDGGKWTLNRSGKTVTVQRSRKELEESRDMFLFCCLTGLRFSDMQRLEWVHVFPDCIKMYTKKTMKLVEVALNPVSLEILDRRWEERDVTADGDDGVGGGYVFPRISNAALNADLKVIGEMLCLDGRVSSLVFKGGERVEGFKEKAKALTTHSGRHTFAVQALSAGVPGSVVMGWTGHSDYNSLKPYLGITSDAKRKGMKRFEEYMEDVFASARF